MLCTGRRRKRTMISEQARRFWAGFAGAPRQIDLPLAQRREAGEHAEDTTAEPTGVRFGPAAEVDGLWAEPADATDGAAMIYLFGGGYVLGSPASRRKTAGHLAAASGMGVLVPNYRLAPEHPFPTAVEDAVRAYSWLTAQRGPSAQVFVAGDSAGGGLALATAIAVRDRKLMPPAGVVTLSLWGDLTCSGASMTDRAARDLECTPAGQQEMA